MNSQNDTFLFAGPTKYLIKSKTIACSNVKISKFLYPHNNYSSEMAVHDSYQRFNYR